MAAVDERVVAGASIGSLAYYAGDRWSDLDLTFAVADSRSLLEILDDWTRVLVEEFCAVHLFDLSRGSSLYRVFLLPGCLQFDLSFTPQSDFGSVGPNFRLLFGAAIRKPHLDPPPAAELFGYAVHHAMRARFCIERGRYWQAEYWTSGVRNFALSLAARRRGLQALHGRGHDDLPEDVHIRFIGAFARSLDRDELLRALSCAIHGLLSESAEVADLAERLRPELLTMLTPVFVRDGSEAGNE
jgi:hypothetical protein